MRKGQIQQVFIYIMAMLVIGAIVVIGYKFILSIMEQGCDIEDNQFVQSLADGINQGDRYERVANPSLLGPCDYTILCLVDAESIGGSFDSGSYSSTLDERMDVITSSVEGGIPYNVFLIREGTQGTTRPVLVDDRITIEGSDMLCINKTSGRFDFWVKGLGREGILVYD